MRYRDHIALTLPTFLLRLTLAITFLWAGTAKIIGTTSVQGDSAARLANLGVPFLTDAPQDLESTIPDEPVNPLPDSNMFDPPADDASSEEEPSETPEQPQIDPPIDPLADPSSDPEHHENSSNPMAMRNMAKRNMTMTTSPAVASDYPEPVHIKRVYGIALLLDTSTNPTLSADSQPITPTMPSWFSIGQVPVYAAWATAATEILAGLLLLIGFLTRFSAIGLCVVMLVAMWTTNIGPAALQSSDAILGFIPRAADPWDPSSYQTLLWQLALIVMSLSVALLGAGPLSLDRVFFRPSRRDPYISGESVKPVKQKPAQSIPLSPPRSAEPLKDRSEFDRAPPPQNNPTP